MTGPDRAVAVAIADGRVLVVVRHRPGQEYAVLPGGGVEPGETVTEAAVRELREETGLTATAAEVLWVRGDGGRTATYVRMVDLAGTLRLGGPERERSTPDNSYRVAWAGPEELDRLGLQPDALRLLIRELVRAPTG